MLNANSFQGPSSGYSDNKKIIGKISNTYKLIIKVSGVLIIGWRGKWKFFYNLVSGERDELVDTGMIRISLKLKYLGINKVSLPKASQ